MKLLCDYTQAVPTVCVLSLQVCVRPVRFGSTAYNHNHKGVIHLTNTNQKAYRAVYVRGLDQAAEGRGSTQQEAAANAASNLIERYANLSHHDPSEKMAWHDLDFYIYADGEAK